MVARFRQIDAIILGVTVSTEGGVTPLGHSLAFDGPFNPYDPDYYPGGSSLGSAVVVAACLAPVALGFDGGGSIRVPANISENISETFGLAPTFGRVETTSVLELTVSKAGPLAASTADMALAHLVLSQKDKTHFYSQLYDGGVSGVLPAHVSGLDHSIKGMRLGIYWDHFQHSDPEIVEACIQTVEFLKRQGAEIVNIIIPHLREIHLSHGLKILSEIGVIWDSPFYDPNLSFEANTDITIAMGKELTAVEVLAGEKIRTWALVLHVDSVLLFCLCRYCT
jgi:Asp-tRNA(Asn)/Glu-tRNA(Gln) amidotransferase A subunit family amidase